MIGFMQEDDDLHQEEALEPQVPHSLQLPKVSGEQPPVEEHHPAKITD